MDNKEKSIDEKVVSFLLGVLEDYSNRYIGFGALFAACIFGIYTLLGWDQFKNYPVSIIVFILLLFIGLFSLLFTYNYLHYTRFITNHIIENDSECKNAYNQAISEFKINPILKIIHLLYKKLLVFDILLIFTLVLIYIFITLIPICIYYDWKILNCIC